MFNGLTLETASAPRPPRSLRRHALAAAARRRPRRRASRAAGLRERLEARGAGLARRVTLSLRQSWEAHRRSRLSTSRSRVAVAASRMQFSTAVESRPMAYARSSTWTLTGTCLRAPRYAATSTRSPRFRRSCRRRWSRRTQTARSSSSRSLGETKNEMTILLASLVGATGASATGNRMTGRERG